MKEENPFINFVKSNLFALECYKKMKILDLERKVREVILDEISEESRKEMRDWGFSEQEWLHQIELTLVAKRWAVNKVEL